MNDRITNAKDRKISELSSSLPDVMAAVQELLQPTTATVIEKRQISGYTKEVRINVETKASIQPADQKLDIKPEGQRAWKYWTMYCLNNLDLKPDQGFLVRGQGYRVIDKTDWNRFGYYKYEIIEDYQIEANVSEDTNAT